ncbi:hypothetical protein O1L44_19800 [Streptomyces noursei]|uniref:hypothetical protein n=1 Tax=Streptomyces noursei TaxID=1971 RepID=UPI0013520B86|nr:hypothetical protein [Streptomyces noursei]
MDPTDGGELRVVDPERFCEMSAGLMGGLVARSEVNGRDGPVTAASATQQQLPIVTHEQQERAPILLRAGDVADVHSSTFPACYLNSKQVACGG